jgi:hypothetical protein
VLEVQQQQQQQQQKQKQQEESPQQQQHLKKQELNQEKHLQPDSGIDSDSCAQEQQLQEGQQVAALRLQIEALQVRVNKRAHFLFACAGGGTLALPTNPVAVLL